MKKKHSPLRLAVEALFGLGSPGTNQYIAGLTPRQKLRLAAKHLDVAATLDIETTGFSPYHDQITVIGLYHLGDDREEVFVQGRNLDDFPEALNKLELIVTYNGARFDLPFIRRAFGMEIHTPHIDLMPVLRAYGYHGGQKAIERRLGLRRPDSEGIDGHIAVRLWGIYEETGDEKALEELVMYNLEDCRMLAEILCAFCGAPIS